jgi:hypothetical protein
MGAQALASSACARPSPGPAREIVRRERGSMTSGVRRSHGRPRPQGQSQRHAGASSLEPRASSLEPVLMQIRDAVLLSFHLLSFHLPACHVLMGPGRAGTVRFLLSQPLVETLIRSSTPVYTQHARYTVHPAPVRPAPLAGNRPSLITGDGPPPICPCAAPAPFR